MNTDEQNGAWLERIEDLVGMLEGSTVSELELSEGGTEIIIRRQSSVNTLSAAFPSQVSSGRAGIPMAPGVSAAPLKQDTSLAVTTPQTGVYYSSPSPDAPPFVSPGDVVQAGQVVALIEAMKVFNEIQSEVAGRVVSMLATHGDVVQKDDVLIRVQPAP